MQHNCSDGSVMVQGTCIKDAEFFIRGEKTPTSPGFRLLSEKARIPQQFTPIARLLAKWRTSHQALKRAIVSWRLENNKAGSITVKPIRISCVTGLVLLGRIWNCLPDPRHMQMGTTRTTICHFRRTPWASLIC